MSCFQFGFEQNNKISLGAQQLCFFSSSQAAASLFAQNRPQGRRRTAPSVSQGVAAQKRVKTPQNLVCLFSLTVTLLSETSGPTPTSSPAAPKASSPRFKGRPGFITDSSKSSDRDVLLLVEVPPDYSPVACTFPCGITFEKVLQHVLALRNLTQQSVSYRLLDQQQRPVLLSAVIKSKPQKQYFVLNQSKKQRLLAETCV